MAGKVCRLEGVFILEGTGGVHVLDLAIPLDPATDRVALVHDLADYDVTVGGLLPTAVRYTTAQGEAVRTGPRSFDYTLHFWGVDSSNRRVSLVVSSGAKVFREGDCGVYDTSGAHSPCTSWRRMRTATAYPTMAKRPSPACR